MTLIELLDKHWGQGDIVIGLCFSVVICLVVICVTIDSVWRRK